MQKQLKHLPKPVARILKRFQRRKRAYALLQALLAPLLCYGLLALLAMHADRFLFLDVATRVWISHLTHGLTAITALGAMGWFALSRPRIFDLAYELERMLPQNASERIVTLHDILAREHATPSGQDSGVHQALVEQLTGETIALCNSIPHAARLARAPRLRRQGRMLGILAILWLSCWMFPDYQFPLMWQRLTTPRANLPKPSFMQVTITPAAPVIGKGGEVVFQVEVEGAIPRWLRTPMRWLGADSGRSLLALAPGHVEQLPFSEAARPMSRIQRQHFVATLSDLEEDFSFRVRCGDAQTGIHQARVVAQPRVLGLQLRVQPPAYTGLETIVLDDLQDPVSAFAGSEITFEFTADQAPLQSARLVALQDGEPLAELSPGPETDAYRHVFEMRESMDLELVLVNTEGFRNVERVHLSLTLREDQPPSVRLDHPVGEITAVEGALIPIRVEMTDDLGLLQGAIRFQVNPETRVDAPFREISLPVEEGARAQTISARFDLETTGVMPGDEILLWIRARDTGRNDELSQPVRIRVTSLAGNPNERRRLQALRLLRNVLDIARIESNEAPDRIVLDPDAYESLAAEGASYRLSLPERPAQMAFLAFLAREHYFTDDPRAAHELRLMHGILQALWDEALTDKSGPQRIETIRWLAHEALPALLPDRMARDLVRRILNLRAETLAVENSMRELHATLERAQDAARTKLATLAWDVAQRASKDELLEQAFGIVQADRQEYQRLVSEVDQLTRNLDSQISNNATLDEIEATEERLDAAEQQRDATFDGIVIQERKLAEAIEVFQSAIAQELGLELPLEATVAELIKTVASAVWNADDTEEKQPLDQQALLTMLAPILARQSAPGTLASPEQATYERRIGLLMEAILDTGSDLAALSRLTQEVNTEDLFAFSERINRAGHDLRHVLLERRQAAPGILLDQMDGWIQLVQPHMPVWQTQRNNMRQALAARHTNLRMVLQQQQQAARPTPLALLLWFESEARLLDFSPFASAAERLATLRTGQPDDAPPPVPALEQEADPLARWAIKSTYLDWLDSPRISPEERELAASLQALDLADGIIEELPDSLAPRQDDPSPTSPDQAVANGLPLSEVRLQLARTFTLPPQDSNARLEAIIAQAEQAASALSELAPPANPDDAPAFIQALENGKTTLHAIEIATAEAARDLYLDLAYGDPRRDAVTHMIAALPAIRDALERYHSTVPALLERLLHRARQEATGAGDLSAITLDIADLGRRVAALATGLERARILLAGDGSAHDTNPSVHETQRILTLLWQLHESGDPAAEVVAFFQEWPPGAAIVLEPRIQRLAQLQPRIESAARSLTESQTDQDAFRSALREIETELQAFARQLQMLTAFDPEGIHLGRITDLRNRLQTLRETDDATDRNRMARDRLAMDDVQHQWLALVHGLGEQLATLAPSAPDGWWGAPAGAWDATSRQDAEHARARNIAHFSRARHQAVQHLATILMPDHKDAPIDPWIQAAFAWRLLHAPIGGQTTRRRVERDLDPPRDPLVQWLMNELNETRNTLRRTDGIRRFHEQTSRWVESVSGYLRY